MAYNVVYTSIPVMVTSLLDKDLSEKTVMEHPEILYFAQAGRLINPSTFVNWFLRSIYHAIVVFVVTVRVYAYEKCEMLEMSMVALSGCIWLQAFLVSIETNSFTVYQHLAVWGNVVIFYILNLFLSLWKHYGMHTIMFRVCSDPVYWFSLLLIVVAGMGPLAALKFYRSTYRPNAINMLQLLERQSLNSVSVEAGESSSSSSRSVSKSSSSHGSVFEPLLSDPTSRQNGVVSSSEFLPSSPNGRTRLSNLQNKWVWNGTAWFLI